jgi:hypothetical protein
MLLISIVTVFQVLVKCRYDVVSRHDVAGVVYPEIDVFVRRSGTSSWGSDSQPFKFEALKLVSQSASHRTVNTTTV